MRLSRCLPALLLSVALVPGVLAPAAPASASPVTASTATPTATTAPDPTPQPTHGGGTGDRVALSVSPSFLVAGRSAVVTAQGAPGRLVRLYAYTRPSTTLRLVREGTLGADGTVAWTVVPTASTRFVAELGTAQESAPLVLPVAPRVTFHVEDGCRVRGAVYPAAAGAGGVALVRLVDERNVLLARADVDARGRYALRRCLSGHTGDEVLTLRLPRSLTWAPAPLPVVVRHVDCSGRCLPGPDVVLDVDGPAPDRTEVLERQQGLLLKVRSDPSTGSAVAATADGGLLRGPERSFLPDPSPDGQPRPGSGGRDFFRFVAARPGTGTVVVTRTPPGGGPVEELLRVRVTVR